MFSLLLILLAVPLADGCRIAPSTECEKPQFVPGHNLVGEGFDIVRMKTSGAFVVNVRDYMTGGDHGNCTICSNRLLNLEQKLPASVLDWRVKVHCRRSISAKVYESSSSMLKETSSSSSVSLKVELGIPYVAGVAVGGTHSRSSRFAQSHSSKDKFSYTSHKFSCKYYSFRLHSRPPLTKEFLGSIKTLPAQYNSQSKARYESFISTYGTHFLRQVDLGGRVHSTTAVRTCQVSMTGLSVQDVSNCLSLEASAIIKGVKVSGQTSYCKNKGKKLQKSNSFSGSFSDRVTEVLGGDGSHGDILFAPDKQKGYTAWLKTLKTVPGVVSYRLSSLHMLVRNDTVRRTSLQKAIRAYIMKSAVSLSCSSKCKNGRRINCACKCSGHQRIDSNCCPSQPGIATLTVTVERAAGLWGDYFSKTDGYVKIFYGSQADTTRVIWNNNFPIWNHVKKFETVDLTKRMQVRFEVWDRDNRWDDDLLGKAALVPNQGNNMKKSFRLKHGTLYVSVTAVCGPHLSGPVCEKYVPSPTSEDRLTYLNALEGHRRTLIQGPYEPVRNSSFL
ncbi:perforin-1-like [Pygocentrus nattereri]|uniref:Perforin 1.3 n=1 Tax=Pygocentrus nattereri TaxID=42514 RepID=A0A3B4CR45_PYGNA|nr:perforin-1-like [Pygocentrus nattereri]